MDGLIDLIAGLFNFLYMCASDIIIAVIENPLRLIFLFLLAYPIYHLFYDKSYGGCNDPSDDELQRNIDLLGKQIDELTDDFNKLADNIKQQPSKPKDK